MKRKEISFWLNFRLIISPCFICSKSTPAKLKKKRFQNAICSSLPAITTLFYNILQYFIAQVLSLLYRYWIFLENITPSFFNPLHPQPKPDFHLNVYQLANICLLGPILPAPIDPCHLDFPKLPTSYQATVQTTVETNRKKGAKNKNE